MLLAVVAVVIAVVVLLYIWRSGDAYAAPPPADDVDDADDDASPAEPPPESAAAVRARGALEHLDYRERTCENLRRMYEPILRAGTCDADVSANLPVSAAARPSIALALQDRCRGFPSVRALGAAIDECRDD